MTRICPDCELAHPDVETCAEALKKALRSMVLRIGAPGFCSACGQAVYWIGHLNGKRAPYTAAGLNHFIDCPEAERFGKSKTGSGGR